MLINTAIAQKKSRRHGSCYEWQQKQASGFTLQDGFQSKLTPVPVQLLSGTITIRWSEGSRAVAPLTYLSRIM